MQPGKPQGFGVIGEDETPIFTLPGNPVSAYVSFEVFVLPGAPQADGPDAVLAPDRRARLTHGVSSPAGRRQFVRGHLGVDAAGALRRRPSAAPGRT